MKSKARSFRLWTYDVWGNEEDGFDVNDRFSRGTVTIRCKAQTFNVGTPQEFTTFEPTDRQLSNAAGFNGVEWEGSDGAFYATEKDNGRPVGELCEAEAE